MGFREPEQFAIIRGEDDYAGLEVRVRLNISLGFVFGIQRRMVSEIQGEPEEAMREFGDAVLMEWNVEGRDGQPLPANGEGVLQGSVILLTTIIGAWVEAVKNPPLASVSGSNGRPSTASASVGAARRRRS